MITISQRPETTDIFEFQGEFEHLELFDGVYDEEKLQLKFKGFTLQGRRAKKEFTVIEKDNGEFYQRSILQEVILFDQPLKFNL